MLYAELSLFGSLFLVQRVPHIELNVRLRQCMRFDIVEVINLVQFIGENMVQFRMFENVTLLPKPTLSFLHVLK